MSTTIMIILARSVVVSVKCCYAGDPGSFLGRRRCSVNHSLAPLRCKIGTSPMCEDGM